MQKFYFLFFAGLLFVAGVIFVFAAGEMVADTPPNYFHWAWNDLTDWINLRNDAAVKGIVVGNTAVSGIATSGVGDIYFDCASFVSAGGILPSGPPQKTCLDYPAWKVSNDAGNLSGFAWNDAIGWISFWCNDVGGCATSNYRVTIDGGNGNFSGYAWNDLIGWINFWCGNPGDGSCAAVNYRAKTTWTAPLPVTGSLDSSVFNAGASVIFNSILWQGNLNGGAVQFQVASSNVPGGPWTFVGTDHTSASFYNAPVPGRAVLLDGADHSGKQYVRYRILLTSAAGKSPRINDVIINWSR